MKIIEKYVDVQTGEETITERDETIQEESSRLELIALQAETESNATIRQALLTRLGITEEEARILLGGN